MIRDGQPRRRLLWLLLGSFAFALTGFVVIEIPATRQTDSQERFPCEDSLCGCSVAEHCWDQCCCHTDREKLDWARRNGVSPPQFLMARVAESDNSTSRPTCCGSSHAPPKEDAGEETGDDEESVAPPRKLAGIAMWQAAECRGLKYFCTALAGFDLTPGHEVSAGDPPVPGWIVLLDERALSHESQPDPPVPWLRGCWQ